MKTLILESRAGCAGNCQGTFARRAWYGVGLLAIFGMVGPWLLVAQPAAPFGVPTTAAVQRNAIRTVQSEANWLINAVRSAPRYGSGGYGMVVQHFQRLQGSYGAFVGTLTPEQTAAGVAALDDLSAGLEVLEGAFARYDDELASGRPDGAALQELYDSLRRGTGAWVREFNRVCNQLHLGRM